MSDSISELDNLYPLSHGQRALWFMQRLAPDGVAYNFAHAARILTELDVTAFQRAIQRLVRRHPALRTTFPSRDGEPAQRIHDHAEFHFRAEDATRWSEARLNERLAEEVYRPFDLARGPLLRVFLFTRSVREHIVLLATHHIVADLWSVAVVMSELGALYAAEKAGVSAALDPPLAKYTDYVRQQSELLAGPEGERLWAYWRKHLAGASPILNLPTDRPRPPVQTDRGAAETLRLTRALSQGLKALARAHGVTSYMALLATFQTLLHHYAGQEDILVASPIMGRSREMANLVGYFVNPLVMRADFSGDPTFSSLLGQVRQTALEAFEHSAYPFPLLVERLQPARDPSRPPLAQVVFAWQQTTRLVNSHALSAFALGESGGGRLELGKLQFEAVSLRHRVAPFELTLLMADVGDELAVTMEYNTELFNAATITRMLDHFRNLLEAIASDPDRRIAALPLLTKAEEQQVLREWNRTQAEYSTEVCVHRLFEEQAASGPGRTAVIFEQERLTYEQLDRRANQLANYLRRLGVGPETFVGLCVERSIEMIVGILGILKAGGAYVPLDPSYPKERLVFILEDINAKVAITEERLASWVSGAVSKVVRIDSDWGEIEKEKNESPEISVGPDNLAYAIYTSGSTGKPKGVLVTHENLVHSTAARFSYYREPVESFLLLSSFAFDSSVAGIFWTLCQGGALVLPSEGLRMDLPQLTRLIRENRISHTLSLPSLYSLLLKQAKAEEIGSLRTVIVAGESCPRDLIDRHYRALPDAALFNEYGPTEGSVWSSVYMARPAEPLAQAQVPIGGPIPNMRVYLLNPKLEPIPVGAAGEIYIGGMGITRGYLNRPDLTAERFIPDPFGGAAGGRLYRTGDLARYLPDGNIDFLGRVDQQVKIRGYRIELGEIETALQQHPAIREAVVLVREDEPGNKRLVAYLVSVQEAAPTIGELHSFLRRKLPGYMAPAAYVWLESLPMTPNGKIDRRALPAPDKTRPELGTEYLTPRNKMEQALAEVWQKVLGIERVGVHDNFFDLGGHSLMLVKAHSQMQEVLDLELPMIELFKYPTISALAEYLSREDGGQPSLQISRQRAREQREAMNLG
jgi:amino acid adenylation domain-containing protein